MNDQTHWFSEKEGSILLYKVNRRKKFNDMFGDLPSDVFQHVQDVLLFGEPIITGRKHQRTWYLGNKTISKSESILSGHIGWEKHDPTSVDSFDETDKRWIDTVENKGISARSIFSYCAINGLLGIAKHPTFREQTIAKVFTDLLNLGEKNLTTSVTEWEVEPILDNADFKEWLDKTESLEKVKFVAKLPNPGGYDEFADVWERLNRVEAAKIEEIVEARDPQKGLRNITSDKESAQYIAMSSRGYGYITATGTSGKEKRRYDQRERVRRLFVVFPENWTGLEKTVKDSTKSSGNSD